MSYMVPYVFETKDGGSRMQEHPSPDPFPVFTGRCSTSQTGGLKGKKLHTQCLAHATDSAWQKLLGLFSAFYLLPPSFMERLYLLCTRLRSWKGSIRVFQLQNLVLGEMDTQPKEHKRKKDKPTVKIF